MGYSESRRALLFLPGAFAASKVADRIEPFATRLEQAVEVPPLGVATSMAAGAREQRETIEQQEYQAGDVIRQGDTSSNFFNMTFDDFWGNPAYVRRNLETILYLGQKYGAKFTLFPVGQGLLAAPDLWQEAAREGHAIENHSYTHPLLGLASKNTIRYQIQTQQQIVQQVLGDSYKPQRFFRPPGGDGILSHYNPGMFAVAQELGLILAVWSASSPGVLDYPRADSAEITKIILSCPAVPGDLILQHAITADVIAAEYILQSAQNNGINSRTLGDEVDSLLPAA